MQHANDEPDHSYLLKALSFAATARGFCAPNPAVGAAIVSSLGEIVATGYHTGPGNAHAEVDALKKISHQAQGMTLYVTLEPCCHTGRTPPCTDAILKSGIARVVYGYRDPNPIVSGKGANILTEAGIICEHRPLSEISAFYESYLHWHVTQKPFITAKLAMTLDGKIAGKGDVRVQITGEALQALTHEYRKCSDAILTTAETINKDDPQLNVRLRGESIAKPIYVLDSQLRLNPEATVFKTAKSITLFHDKLKNPKAFASSNVRCIGVDKDEAGLNLQQVVQQIGRDGIHDLWVEAGGKCFSAFVKNQLVQKALIYLAPHWLGEGVNAFADGFSLEDYHPHSAQWRQVGEDGVVEMRF